LKNITKMRYFRKEGIIFNFYNFVFP
jgi:hypothetical protein